jgi:TPR repeat protein
MTRSGLSVLVVLLASASPAVASPGEIGGGISRVCCGTGSTNVGGLAGRMGTIAQPGEAAYLRAVHIARYEGAAAAARPLEQAANMGSPSALYELGLMYVRGNGVARDESRGIALIEQAAEKELPAAMLALASALYSGEGVAQDRERARHWLVRAAETGYRPAMEARRRLASH